jgi:glycosyltransferase involved in cell wall biosynthesis
MIDLSIIYITYRQGGYDILADGLSRQTNKNYELIIIDDFLPDRSTEVQDYLKYHGITPKYLGPSKEKCFPELSFGIFNAVNTGFIQSEGNVVVLVTDYQWFEPDCFAKIAAHEDKLMNRTCVVLPARTWDCDIPRDNTGRISVWNPHWSGNPLSNYCFERASWIPEGLEFAFTAFPWNIIEEMNGYPEYLDAVSAQPLESIMECFNAVGTKAYVDTNNFMHAINHRDWQPAELWYQSARHARGSTALIKRPNTFNLKNIRKLRSKYKWLTP